MACGRRTYSSISWRVTLGESSASPAATVAMPASRSAGGVSFSRNPLAPAFNAPHTYSSSALEPGGKTAAGHQHRFWGGGGGQCGPAAVRQRGVLTRAPGPRAEGYEAL